MKALITLAIAAVCTAAVGTGPAPTPADGPAVQPQGQEFSHTAHASLFNSCNMCHSGVGDPGGSYYPDPSFCATCHNGTMQPRVDWTPPAYAPNANLNFNGNDAVVLSFDGTPVDRLGRVGEDPGSSWSCDAGSTLNHTLRRLIGVCEGDANVGDLFDPCSGWQFYASDTINGLGFHIADCGAVPNGTVSWSALKAGYR